MELLPTLEDLTYVDYLEPLIITAMNTGLRKGELLSLSWKEVVFSESYVTVTAENAKSKKRRNVPLNKTALNALKQWRMQNLDAEYVFTSGSSEEAITDVKKPWMKILKEAGIDDFRFHDLRHHFASRLVMAGVDLNTVRELLGVL